MRFLLYTLLCLALAPQALAHQSHGTHAHGLAELRVVVDGPVLLLDIESPLDNLVGFEHAPRTEEQRVALNQAYQALTQFESLFRLPAAAACTLRDAHVEFPWVTPGHGQQTDAAHADLHAVFELDCANPEALTELEVRWFEVFPRTERIRADTASPRGQGSATLSKNKTRLPL